MRTVGFVDSTLRAAQQSLWESRMTGEMLLPYLGRMDRTGFDAIDVMGGTVFESCVRTLREDPWERIRFAADRVVNTPLNAWTRGGYVFGTEPLAAEVVELAIGRMAANGIRRHTCYDPLNELDNLALPVRASKNVGVAICGALVYSLSSAHTNDYFVEKARGLVALGVDAVCLADPGGVLHPDAARGLLPALRAAIGSLPLELSTHCRSGRAEIACLDGVRLGVNVLHTATMPLAGGVSLPPVDYFVEHLGHEHFACRPTKDDLDAMADYFAALAEAPWPAHGRAPVV